MDAMRHDHGVDFTREGKLIIGTKDNQRSEPDIERLRSFFKRAGLEVETPADIHRALWWKWMVNIGVNQVSAVIGAPYKAFQAEGPARDLMVGAMRETIAVAEAEGIDLHEDAIEDWFRILAGLGPDNKTSMLQDIEAGRITEAPSFGGRLAEIARAHGVSVPINETLVKLIAACERLALSQDG
jgi:2-dehydropantoate 2-reductase